MGPTAGRMECADTAETATDEDPCESFLPSEGAATMATTNEEPAKTRVSALANCLTLRNSVQKPASQAVVANNKKRAVSIQTTASEINFH